MYLAGRSHIIKNRSLIDTMRMFHKMGYGGLELSLQHGMGTWLDVNYLDDYVIEKVNEVSRELDFPITALACHQNYVNDDDTYEIEKRLLKAAERKGSLRPADRTHTGALQNRGGQRCAACHRGGAQPADP